MKCIFVIGSTSLNKNINIDSTMEATTFHHVTNAFNHLGHDHYRVVPSPSCHRTSLSHTYEATQIASKTNKLHMWHLHVTSSLARRHQYHRTRVHANINILLHHWPITPRSVLILSPTTTTTRSDPTCDLNLQGPPQVCVTTTQTL